MAYEQVNFAAWFSFREGEVLVCSGFAGDVAEIFGIVVFYGGVDEEKCCIVGAFAACEGDFADFFGGGTFEDDAQRYRRFVWFCIWHEAIYPF